MTTQDQDSKGDNAQNNNTDANPPPAADQTSIAKLRQANKELLEANKRTQAELDSIKQNHLKEKEDYKSLFEQTSNENKTLKEDKERLQKSVVYSERFRAVFPELKKQGLVDQAHKYVEDLSLDDLEIETTSQGRFIVKGTGGWVERFKAENPLLFQTPKPANVNTGGGRSADMQADDITPARIFELEQIWKKSGKPDDRKAYESAYRTYAEKKKKS